MSAAVDGTGYLSSEDDRLFDAHLYIAAMGRSGSTYLANLLTTPPKRWVMVEPWFVNGLFNRFIRDRAAEFGWPIDVQHWHLPAPMRTRAAFLERYRSFLAPKLNELERWGAKGVRADFHIPTITTINPRNMIVLVRDLRQVSLSLLEKNHRQGKKEEENRRWVELYVAENAQSLLKLCEIKLVDALRVVRYEDVSRSASEKRAIETWLDWPMDGDEFANLEDFGRGYEVERHTSPELVERQLPSGADDFVAKICEQNSSYQDRFGY
ncbi:hypothetical protein [Neoaquamicrobium sediminum]|uniref:Sulfotransferase family protein n=1 Tax=Neoaquamicrobium sediminum TaxID=1849104 RepID=A0ABV3X0H3_9HYPH